MEHPRQPRPETAVDAVGRVLAKLRETGLEERTLVVFLSDNGGPTPSTTSGNGPLRGFKAQTWEGGIRVPMFAKWSSHLKPGTYSQPVIQMDLTATILALAGVKHDAKWPMGEYKTYRLQLAEAIEKLSK